MTDKASYKRKIQLLESMLEKERANNKILLEQVRKYILTIELQKEMIKQERYNGQNKNILEKIYRKS